MESVVSKGFKAYARKHELPESLYPIWREAWFQSRKGVAKVLVNAGVVSNEMKGSVTEALRRNYEDSKNDLGENK